MKPSTGKAIKHIFAVCCVLLTGYMVMLQLLRFIQNNDVSTSDFKRFNHSPLDVYPTYSICMNSNKGGIFVDQYLEDAFGPDDSDQINSEMYASMLSGKEYPNISTEINAIKNLPSTYDDGTIQFNDFAIDLKYEQRLENRSIIANVEGNDNLIISQDEHYTSSFYIPFQNHQRKCFTRESKFSPRTQQIYDRLTINATKLAIQSSVDIKVFIHHPGQLCRNFDKPFLAFPVSYFATSSFNEFKNKFVISQINVLRKRPDANVPCNPTLKDDDEMVLKAITEKVGCVPPYWVSLLGNNNMLPTCNTSSQMNDIFEYQCNSFESCPERPNAKIH